MNENFKGIIKHYKVFIDTCSLMHESAFPFFNSISKLLKESGTGIIIAQAVVDELEKKAKSKDRDIKDKALDGIKTVEYLIDNEIGQKYGDKDDGFVDNLFQSLFIKYREKYDLCLITQDVKLMKDIYDLSKSRSVDFNKKIIVYKFAWVTDNSSSLIKKFFPHKDHNIVKNILSSDDIVPFKASRKVVDEKEFNNIRLSVIPKIGDTVTSNKGIKIRLRQEIASGAEGSIYAFEVIPRKNSSDNYLCKIYKENKINNAVIEKLKLMISRKVDIEGVCWPISLLYNYKKEIVGYVMKRAYAHELQRSLFVEPLRLEKLGSNWTRKDLIRLSINILSTIDILHKYNIIIGDINPGNILVDKNANAYFIDTDSYQIEGYPCPVGSPSFTHPDILRRRFTTFLRKKEHEYFAISTLLFMILVPGKSPFAFQGGSSPAANVKKRNFVYPFKSKDINHFSKDINKNRWWYVWNNFPHRLKEAFYKSFVESDMIKIIGKNGWIEILDAYNHNIENSWVSDELFPATQKEVSEDQIKKFNNGD